MKPTQILFALLILSAHAKNASTPPTAANIGTVEPCGNPLVTATIGTPVSEFISPYGPSTTSGPLSSYYKGPHPDKIPSYSASSQPEDCQGCEDYHKQGTKSPTGSSCDSSPINSYNGNAHRGITDLTIAGSVGNFPLEFKRFSSSRLSSRNLSQSSFGIETPWSHNYEWIMRDNGGSTTQPIVKITYPDGVEHQFRRPDATATTWLPTNSSVADRLLGAGDDFTPRTGDLAQYIFKRRYHSVTGGVFYRIESIKDPESNAYTISYDNNDDTLIRQVTDSANHWIKFHYNDIAIRSNASTTLSEQLLPSGSTNVWKEVTLTPGASFRFLALYQGNSWRQKVPLRVTELEFYDHNNVKITGTALAHGLGRPTPSPTKLLMATSIPTMNTLMKKLVTLASISELAIPNKFPAFAFAFLATPSILMHRLRSSE